MKKVASGVTTIYNYDVAGNLISESEADGTLLRDIVYLNGERVAMRLYGSQAGWYYFVNDHLGTPQKVVDSSGVVVWQAAYLPFGKAQVLAGSTIVSNFGFPGHFFSLRSSGFPAEAKPEPCPHLCLQTRVRERGKYPPVTHFVTIL